MSPLSPITRRRLDAFARDEQPMIAEHDHSCRDAAAGPHRLGERRPRLDIRREAERQTAGDVRVSTWAIAVAVLIALAAVGWVLIRNH